MVLVSVLAGQLPSQNFTLFKKVSNYLPPHRHQVTHHPPMFAMHIEHKDFTMWEEYTVASKFRGKYLVCYPIGNTHIVFHKSGNHYTWNKVVTTIHNIIIGKLWIDQVSLLFLADFLQLYIG